jgi:hypothetical protein
MKKAAWNVMMTAAAVLVFTGTAAAQMTSDVTVQVSLSASAKLDMNGTSTVTFPDLTPDQDLILDATPFTINAKARTRKDGEVKLAVVADGDLTETGGGTIGIGNLGWTTSGTYTGTGVASTTEQTLATWTNSGNRNITLAYTLNNSWGYATGNYSAKLTYTLTTP